jgi:poly-gamma-glutamate capsule biosynthesis protein CapA/YwtB (metallophosphatase superfamily)
MGNEDTKAGVDEAEVDEKRIDIKENNNTEMYLDREKLDGAYLDDEKLGGSYLDDEKLDESYLDDEKLDEIMKDISRAKEEADVVIVFAHWGEEYSTEISEYQKRMADFFAKAGVDAIIGSHPHVVQPMETLKRPDGQDMTVFYSLGNFRAYQGFSPETKQGAEAILTIEHTFDGVRITSASMEPVNSFVDY